MRGGAHMPLMLFTYMTTTRSPEAFARIQQEYHDSKGKNKKGRREGQYGRREQQDKATIRARRATGKAREATGRASEGQEGRLERAARMLPSSSPRLSARYTDACAYVDLMP